MTIIKINSFILYCFLFQQLSGFMIIVIGTWLLLEPSSGHLFNLFMKSLTPQDTVHILSYSFLVLGVVIVTVGFVGCRASLHGTQFLLIVVSD